jgi:hypothetical protein
MTEPSPSAPRFDPQARRPETRAHTRRTNVTMAPVRRHMDNAMVKAIARAFRWREMLEDGTYATIAEIVAVEKINESYVGRVVRLTLLAPEVVDAILSGRQPETLQLEQLLEGFPVEWRAQRLKFRLRT